ncbi:hypothetical protein CASFOL_012036 [Castilleja foliolosa]|uniref:Large ribosomal subunit protein uL30m n=1 Tax=Castilleja foliolosa TaxID=1961234 RepID=A0ABD3DSY1_9LAMI
MSIPGTRKLHRRTLEALRLTKCNRTVMRWNTPTVRGMIQQGHSGHQEAPPAHVRGLAPHQVQPHRHALEYAYRPGNDPAVQRLVVVETEEMYNARKQKDANHKALRPPLVVDYHPSPATDSSSN